MVRKGLIQVIDLASNKFLFGMMLLFLLSVSNACFYADTPGTVYTLSEDLTGTKEDGACITVTADDVTIDCNGYSIIGDSTGAYGILSNNVQNIIITGCTISGYSYGIYSQSTYYSQFTNNEIYDTSAALVLMSSTDNYVINNIAHDSSSYGFYLYDAYGNYLEGNTAYNNGFAGFLVYYSEGNVLSDNNAYDNTRVGFYVTYSDGTSISLATAQGSQYGFYVRGSNIFDLSSATSHSNHYSAGNAYGLYIVGPGDAYITDVHLYDQSAGANSDFRVVGDPVYPTVVAIQNMTIDNPQGNFENYTRINIYDSVDLGTSYNIEWSAEPATPPSSYQSFEQKYAQISGSTFIDEMAFYWLSSESSGHDESKFELWKYDIIGGWTNTDAIINTGANYLSLYDVNPGESTYGILEPVSAPATEPCQIINSPGSYQKSANSVGAPFKDVIYLRPWLSACIVIASDNVDFSCNGYTITNDGTANSTGIVINDSSHTNVTIRDCPGVSGYDQIGVWVTDGQLIQVRNVTAYNNYDGISVKAANSIVTENIAYDNSYAGISVSGTNNQITNNKVYDNVQAGIHLVGSFFSTVRDNIAYGQTIAGINVYGSANNTIINNIAYNNRYGFFDWYTAPHVNNYTGNIAYENQVGFYLYSQSNSRLVDNIMYNNSAQGINIERANNAYVSKGRINGNYNGGIRIVARDGINTTVQLEDIHFYGNGNNDLNVGSDGIAAYYTLNATNLILDNPAGSLQDDTRISIDDTGSGGIYQIKWVAQPATPPLTHSSVEGKYISIQSFVPKYGEFYSVPIDTIRWAWFDSEFYNESRFELWEYQFNRGWINVSGQTLDTKNNYIEVSDFIPSNLSGVLLGFYGVLQNNNIAPSVTIESPGNNSGTSSTDLNYTVSDVNTASCWYYLDDAGPIELPGCTNADLGTLGEGSHSITLFVNDTFGEQTSVTVYFLYDVTSPTVSSIDSPANSTYYNAPVNIDLEFTVSDNFDLDSCWYYLDGVEPIPLPGCENTTIGPIGEGAHNVAVYVNDTANNIDYHVVYFDVKPGPEACGTLEAKAVNHLVQCGATPGSEKVPLVDISVCAYNSSEGSCAADIGTSHQNYESIAANCEPVNCAKTNELGIADIPLPAGDYIIISLDATKAVLESPLGVSAPNFQCAVEEATATTYPVTMYKYLQQITKCDGKKVPGKTSVVQGSELLIIEPEYIVWDSTEELFPILFESTGTWGVTASLETPEGYVPDYESLSTATPGYTAVQFTVTEVGSVPDDVGVTLHLTDPHGKSIIYRSQIGTRLSEKLANAKGVAIDKNGVITGRGKAKGHQAAAPLGDWATILLVVIGVGVIALAAFERSRRIKKESK